MKATTNYQLKLPEGTDNFSEALPDAFNFNANKLDSVVKTVENSLLSLSMNVGTALNNSNISFKICTQAEYDELTEHNATTVYYVSDGDKVTQYLGDIKMTAGDIGGAILFNAPNGITEENIYQQNEIVTTSEQEETI